MKKNPQTAPMGPGSYIGTGVVVCLVAYVLMLVVGFAATEYESVMSLVLYSLAGFGSVLITIGVIAVAVSVGVTDAQEKAKAEQLSLR